MIPWVVGTYLVAAIPFGLVLSTLYGGDEDIRSAGSGNIGATNVARVVGWRIAGPALILDVAKGFLPVLGARYLWPDLGLWWAGLVAGVAFLAHCFSVYLEFRGGKGVATGAGGMLALAPVPTLLAAALWALVLATTGRSSVGALTAAMGLIGLAWWLQPDVVPVVVLLAIGIGLTHLSNIRRLMQGQERQVVRPVRWRGRRGGAVDDPSALLEQGPSGEALGPAMWREPVLDPLDEDGRISG